MSQAKANMRKKTTAVPEPVEPTIDGRMIIDPDILALLNDLIDDEAFPGFQCMNDVMSYAVRVMAQDSRALRMWIDHRAMRNAAKS